MTVESYIRDEPRPARLSLADFRGAWLAVAFFPPGMGSEPELVRLESLRHAFADEDCVLLGSSIDSWFDLHESPAAFPLVADTQGTLARSFGALIDGDPRFGTVLIDPDGVVRYDDLGAGVSADRALAALRELRRAQLDAAA
jgi:alkyl hydroperoxide reductase subunit AhpC